MPVANFVVGKPIVATKFDGKPLTADHRGPARLLVPHLYFWKSAKWGAACSSPSATNSASGSYVAVTTMAIHGASSTSRTTEEDGLAERHDPPRRAALGDSFQLLPSLAAPFRFRPGQHVTLPLTAPDSYTAQRSYSVASAPEAAGVLELAIERFPEGEVSTFLHDIAEAGDAIELSGPIGGHFVSTEQVGRPVLLVAAGSGVASFVSDGAAPRRFRIGRAMLLLFSARTRADLLFSDESLAIAAAYDGFRFVPTLTRERLTCPAPIRAASTRR